MGSLLSNCPWDDLRADPWYHLSLHYPQRVYTTNRDLVVGLREVSEQHWFE